MQGQRLKGRLQLRRKLRDLINHPNTEPIIKAEARRKFAKLFPHDDLDDPILDETQAFIIIDRHMYPFPRTLWHQPFMRIGKGFGRRTVTYGDIMPAVAGAQLVGFYQIGRVILVQFARLIAEDTLARRFSAHGLDCAVRHLDGFTSDCQYQVNFRSSGTSAIWPAKLRQ